ncbi:MAG: hypothetical protein OXH05_04695 [Acidobacteria bacterium]|nr:hypothetical protein [Acidobacteriota bacterium]
MSSRINQFLASSIGWLNAVTAVLIVVVATAVAMRALGGVGVIVGPLVGVAVAVVVCGALAVLINIRDLLAASVDKSDSESE